MFPFFAGVALFRFKLRVPQIIGLVAALVAIYSLPHLIPKSPTSRVAAEVYLVVGGGALIASLAQNGWLSRLLSLPLLIIGGEISYSIYMTHEVVNHATMAAIQPFGPWAAFLVTTAITLVISTILFYLVESPSRNFVKRMLRGKSPPVPQALLMPTSVVCEAYD
jgi:peptidoglycan/LPS O-acetylase OafA/YrhL